MIYKNKALTYADKLLELDASSSNKIISNSSSKHAKDLFYQIIIGAKQSINIISNKLELYDSPKVIRALREVIRKNVEIKILLDGKPKQKNRFFQLCVSYEKCEIRNSCTKIPSHIITRDDKAYRYCDMPNSDRAIASFNDDKQIIHNSNMNIFNSEKFSRFTVL